MGEKKLLESVPWYLFKQWEDYVASEVTGNRSLLGGCRLSYETGTGLYKDVLGRLWVAVECIDTTIALPEERRQEAAYIHISVARNTHNCTISHPRLDHKLVCTLHSVLDREDEHLALATLLFRVRGVAEGVGGVNL